MFNFGQYPDFMYSSSHCVFVPTHLCASSSVYRMYSSPHCVFVPTHLCASSSVYRMYSPSHCVFVPTHLCASSSVYRMYSSPHCVFVPTHLCASSSVYRMYSSLCGLASSSRRMRGTSSQSSRGTSSFWPPSNIAKTASFSLPNFRMRSIEMHSLRHAVGDDDLRRFTF